SGPAPAPVTGPDQDDTPAVPPSSEASRAVAPRVLTALTAIRGTLDTHGDELGRLDAIAGDGDHGIGMRRGATAAEQAARQACARGAGAGTVLGHAADAWADRAGGTSGALWGVLLRAIADTWADVNAPDRARVREGVNEADRKVRELGGARVGDKTMVDALSPFAQSLDHRVREGDTLPVAWREASRVARESADATAGFRPRLGRARNHTEAGLGTPDAGAVSFALITEAVGAALFADQTRSSDEESS
ncbi:DAK2 domain-containing protein, partial [Nocardiopsis sp. MG754419]|uniref:DAK2 domain-containing protein n=1 Tax=Nocardiopsis sp. MG754419 TaxID=2259865 RepID=UPI001BA8146C